MDKTTSEVRSAFGRPLVWNGDMVQRFWNWMSSRPAPVYFSKLVGHSIIDFVDKHVRLRGLAVDFGCGPGYLVEQLIDRGIDTIGVDSSAESVARVQTRLAGRPHFMGASVSEFGRTPLETSSADGVFVIETVEHLPDEMLSLITDEVRRILKPDALVIVTTPNEENLADGETICPNCGSVYHVMQHVRCWSAESLRSTMEKSGFRTIVCRPTLFSMYRSPLRVFHQMKYAICRRKLPHLIYIGTRL